MNRRSFLAAILALLGWKPKPAEPPFPYYFRKHGEGDGWCVDAPLPRDVAMRPVVKLRGKRIHLWSTTGGKDKC